MTGPTGDVATLSGVLDGLAQEGYDETFLVSDDGSVKCRACGSVEAPAGLHVDGLRRLEGVSDPADMAAVLAVRCQSCGARGSVVARYGPEAGPGDEALLLAVEEAPGAGRDVADAASRTEPPAPAPADVEGAS